MCVISIRCREAVIWIDEEKIGRVVAGLALFQACLRLKVPILLEEVTESPYWGESTCCFSFKHRSIAVRARGKCMRVTHYVRNILLISLKTLDAPKIARTLNGTTALPSKSKAQNRRARLSQSMLQLIGFCAISQWRLAPKYLPFNSPNYFPRFTFISLSVKEI